MDDWEKFNETTLPEKEEFYSNLSLEGITSADYMHGKRVWKDLEMKHLGEYHDLYLKIDTLLLTDVFETLWISKAGNFTKYINKIGIINWHMLLMVGRGIRGRIWNAIHWYATAKNKYIKDYDKDK